MKIDNLLIVVTTVFFSLTTANIHFNFVQPGCDASITTGLKGCLSGQTCRANNTCVANKYYEEEYHITAKLTGRAVRNDGRCGTEFEDATCDAGGEFGGCCSGMGWCGKTEGHCLTENGCQSGCSDSDETEEPVVAPPMSPFPGPEDGEAPPGKGASLSEPVLGPQLPSASNGPETKDGTCGASNSNTVCGSFPRGSCCSPYGYCGSGNSFCGEGCQSGPCDRAPTAPLPPPAPAPPHPNPGSFEVVGDSGVPAMHAALLPNGKVVFLDKVEDFTKVKLASGRLAYSVEYDPITNEVTPLAVGTNAFCSGGAFLANGTLVSVGGNGPLEWLDPTVGDGFDGVRFLTSSVGGGSLDGDDWVEGRKLNSKRWYASAQTMADGSIFVASGSLNGLDPSKPENNNPTYEILDASGSPQGASIPMELLEKAQPYYMYPFLHLLPDTNLFIFTSKSSVLFNPHTNTVLKTYPDLPGAFRTYPNTGSSILLPLSHSTNFTPSILLCGGGPYQASTAPTDHTCGLISPLAETANWTLEPMPAGRGALDALNLPDGTLLLLNGYGTGADGFVLASDPALEALIYDPKAPMGERFTTAGLSEVPRICHSVAVLLLDGTVLVAGSNANEMPVLEPTGGKEEFVTEFRVERFVPPYLTGGNEERRPQGVVLSATELRVGGEGFEVEFEVVEGAETVEVVLMHGGFVTHAVHMGQRMVVLENEGFVVGIREQRVVVTLPDSKGVVPPGPYVCFVVVDGVPGVGQMVMVG